jgi:hypothetical protein
LTKKAERKPDPIITARRIPLMFRVFLKIKRTM